MKTVLRRWAPLLITLLVYAGLIAAGRTWFMPLFGDTLYRQMRSRPETQRYEAVRMRVQTANNALREIAVWDSIGNGVPDTPGVFVRIDRPDTMYASHRRQLIEHELGVPSRSSVGVVGVPMTLGSHADLRNVEPRLFFYTGTRGHTPYCVAAIPVNRMRGEQLTFGFRSAHLLGPCYFWARYGEPGPEIDTWLRRGGYRFAEARARDRRFDYAFDPTFFGRVSARWWLGLDGQACLAGRTERCRNVVLDSVPSAWRARSVAAYSARPWEVDEFLPGANSILASVERQFGPERFGRFWTSSLPPEAAFAEAFGVDIGSWVRDWSTRSYGARSAGPGIGIPSLLLSLLFIGLLIGFVVAKARSRIV